MRADLDTLVIVLYCAACALSPSEWAASTRPAGEDPTTSCWRSWSLRRCGVPKRPRLLASRPPSARASVPLPAVAVALQRALPVADAETRFCSGRHSPPKRLVPTTTCGCLTRLRFPAANRSRRRGRASWPPGPGSATARPIRGATGASSSSCSAQPTARSCHFTRLPRTPASGKHAHPARSEPDRGHDDHLRQRLRRRRLRNSRPRAARAAPATKPRRRTQPNQPADRLDPTEGSNRSSTHSKTSSCSNTTATAPQPGSSPASPRASSPSAPASASTNDSDTTAANSPPTPINRSTI